MPSLLRGFAESAHKYPSRPALYLDGQSWTYEELAQKAAAIAASIDAAAPRTGGFAGVFATRGLTAYTGILGILASGRAYVPIHPYFPPNRIRDVVERSGIDVIIAGPEAVDRLEVLLADCPRRLTILTPEVADLSPWQQRHGDFNFLSASMIADHQAPFSPARVGREEPAYLLFTSGSTGKPKGVPVTHGNSRAYIDHICHTYQIGPEDRVSQTFKLAFDLSVHDLFATWSRGACLYPLSRRARMAPGRFIRENGLTLWFSVPTLAMTMARFRQLADGAFPTLRASLFCGEPLPATIAAKWSKAAPNSTVDNLYGPTEATIAITSYRWQGEDSERRCRNGVVPLGKAFPGQRTMVVTNEGMPAGIGEPGELLLSGSQLAPGYWKAPEITAQSFIRLAHTGDTRWYRTGDLVEADESGCLHFLGRLDHQIQLAGHRVELAEIDHALRKACGHDLAISVAWPYQADEVGGVVGFVASDYPVDEGEILKKCREELPGYMVPDRIVTLEDLPCNTSGKIDRNALQRMLDQGEVSQ